MFSKSFIRRYDVPCLVTKQKLQIIETNISCDKLPKTLGTQVTYANHYTTERKS